MDDRLSTAYEHLANSLGEVLAALVEALGKEINKVLENLKSIGAAFNTLDLEWCKALIWAEAEHPEWIRIYERTKKKRIRKKYRDKITRGYQARPEGKPEEMPEPLPDENVEHCVCCGAPVPEGRQVCWQCEHGLTLDKRKDDEDV